MNKKPKTESEIWAIVKFWAGFLGYLVLFVMFVMTSKIPEHRSWFATHTLVAPSGAP